MATGCAVSRGSVTFFSILCRSHRNRRVDVRTLPGGYFLLLQSAASTSMIGRVCEALFELE
jgi:hypothetical protein